jgi:S-adenosylmethionine synthetase
MIRVSEMVLPGHPDKFCDQVADAVIAECVKIEPDAYGQVEVSAWSDSVWLSGGICTRRPLEKPIQDIVIETGLAIGYTPGNHIDAARYQVTSTICQRIDDPTPWSRYVNDQAVIIGWAGYDEKTRYLPPEHCLAHKFREALAESCRGGLLRRQGPDGKLIVRLREEGSRWQLEHVLVTIQHQEFVELMDVCQAAAATLKEAYLELQARDDRWWTPWKDVEMLINPNGPLISAGSDGDNGQTGRKLAVDYYGPRIPIGGGALSGKHLGHIDRVGAYSARDAAVRAVRSGAKECLVRLTYAPNVPEPLDVYYEMSGRGERQAPGFFNHEVMAGRYSPTAITRRIAEGRHFFDQTLPWNSGENGKIDSPGVVSRRRRQ